MPRKTTGGISVGDHVVLYGLGNDELDGASGRVLGECTNQVGKCIVYIESGRQETREYRVSYSNLAHAKDRSKIFPEKGPDAPVDPGGEEAEEEIDDDDLERIYPSNWGGGVKVVVTLRGLHKKDEFIYNGRKARLLEKKRGSSVPIPIGPLHPWTSNEAPRQEACTLCGRWSSPASRERRCRAAALRPRGPRCHRLSLPVSANAARIHSPHRHSPTPTGPLDGIGAPRGSLAAGIPHESVRTRRRPPHRRLSDHSLYV